MVTFNEGDPTGSYTKEIIDGLAEAEEVRLLGKELSGPEEVVIDWQNHDPDTKFESAMSVNWNKEKLVEATIRFGPVATYDMLTPTKRESIEADWVDVVLDASMATRPRLGIDGRDIDLGDMYISEYARPHLRVHREEDGYSTSARKMVGFIEELNKRHKRKFGTLEDRLMDPEFNDILELR